MGPRVVIPVLIAAACLALAGCASEAPESGPMMGTDAASDDHNDADVSFAQDMIPHHQQALVMADVAIEGAETQELQDLAQRITRPVDCEGIERALLFFLRQGTPRIGDDQ